MVETCDFVDLGLGKSETLGKDAQVTRSQGREAVVEQVQVLKEAITAQRLLAGKLGGS